MPAEKVWVSDVHLPSSRSSSESYHANKGDGFLLIKGQMQNLAETHMKVYWLPM